MFNYFLIYSSPYSGAFNLLDTMYIPRACASASVNLTAFTYFYGQNPDAYNFRQDLARPVPVYNQMSVNQEFVFQNGSSCSNFAWLDNGTLNNDTTIWVQTDDENLVGTQRLLLRGCDAMSKLYEINFYVNVSSNSAPEFVTDIQTQWNLNVGDKIHYLLPAFYDPEGNDASAVYINAMENQDFPPFVNFTNSTNTINMVPNNILYQGRTYYFSVVLKEKHSDFMMNIYYMTIKINGDPIDPSTVLPPNKTQVGMSIAQLDYLSSGQILFTQGVNTTMFEEDSLSDFWALFDVYVINNVGNREEIINITFDVQDNMTVNFTVQFQHPYMYGLLNKLQDTLQFTTRNISDDTLTGLLVANITNQTLAVDNNNNTCTVTIPMQFDFRGKTFQYH